MKWTVATCLALWATVAAAAAPAPVPPREVADEDVDFVIGQIKRFLYDSQQPDGNWSAYHSDAPLSGTTALALFALMDAGESPQDPRIAKGLQALLNYKIPAPAAAKSPGNKVLYIVAFRAMALAQAVGNSEKSPYMAPLIADVKWLLNGATAAGAWGYGGPEAIGDNSCSQVALLALWEARRAGLKIDPTILRSVERTWLRRQNKDDGGWSYSALPGVVADSTLSMTAAGMASLYICQDLLSTRSGPYSSQGQMDQAAAFLAKRLKDDYIRNEYLAFCVQRVGMASGQKFLGDMDWYAAGAAIVAQPKVGGRSFTGNWAHIVRASFELIFLARGRIPITFNKLQYGDNDDWNYHPRDLAHFVQYMRQTYERRMRWQIVRIADDVRELLDAPVLLVTGRGELNFTPEQVAKLREYTLRGGTLLLMPISPAKGFEDSARQLLGSMYDPPRAESGGQYALQPLPGDHPVYDMVQKVPNGAREAPMEGVSDGTRLLAILCARDLPRVWQQGAPAPNARGTEFALGANVFLYATGANDLGTRLRPVFVSKGEAQTRHTVRAGWLKHDGNWNTQPYALSYVGEKLQAENKVDLEVTSGVEADYEQLKDQNLVWITGASTMTLKPQEVAALGEYLDKGGMLFVNAVGGSKEFDESARKLLDELLPEANKGYVGETSALMTGRIDEVTEIPSASPAAASGAEPARAMLSFRGPPVGTPKRTRSLRMAGGTTPPLLVYLRNGVIVAVYARFGIHDTLDGHTVHGALSYMPTTARDLAANVVLYSLLPKPQFERAAPEPPAATEPATTEPAAEQ